MALVKAKVLGSAEVKEYSCETIAELKEAIKGIDNYSASINGSPASNESKLEDAQLVTFAPSVKGGQS